MGQTRKRPRAASSSNDGARSRPRPGTSEQAVTAAAPRQIPGFVWDAEKRRYFPAASRAATGREREHKEREQRRIGAIVAAQQKRPPRQQQQQTVPQLLRGRSTTTSSAAAPWATPRRAADDRLAFASLGSGGRPVDFPSTHSIVTALCVFGGDATRRCIAAGYRNGSLALAELDASGDINRTTVHAVDGEITAVHHIGDDNWCFASMGGSGAGGTLTVSGRDQSAQAAYCLAGESIFAACRPAPGQPHRTCVGTSTGIRVANLALDAMCTVFHTRTQSDIISTAFTQNPCVGFGGGRDGHIRLFDMRVDGGRHRPDRGLFAGKGCRHASAVHGLGAEDWLLASASMDGQTRIWDVRMVAGPSGPAALCASSFGSPLATPAACRLGFDVCRGTVAAAGSDNQVHIWSLHSGQLLQRLPLAAAEGSCTALVLPHAEPGPPGLYLGQSGTVHAFRCGAW
ncbi:hypothetical protein H4R19_003142 [Coemansia spiralis]|nr:hypothetical protein H4R19_003142 [Coemansia spiralis]